MESPRKRLDRDVLVTTALALADAEGLTAVTTRRVGQEHGVSPMALYRHFRDKDQILDAIAERLLSEVRLPEPDDRVWDVQLRDVLTALLTVLRPHAAAAGLVTTRILGSPPGLAIAERTLELLAAAGFGVEQGAEIASQSLCSMVTLVVTEPGRVQTEDPQAREDAVQAKRASLESLSPVRYPHLVAAAGALASCASGDVYYARGVELLVAGIRGVRTGTPTPAV
ncbi:TetR/AcrR family transcriptional regulator [Streptomyces sp. MI02-7b]|uniref:TetR/AcrR family transcriptional regulator n=1 Tax=Streptomyces sp. MI02-7b TaxID=462941 RepID=UPI0029A81AD4|nr:TetR/AcrR family transcriptional regulator [Streptomyces sp. MI02-7b]MDX3072383.1 TetR/AcrR family transcriptional regulator [Streptomyces sp. MI02-7b]